jgi:hypothetical protein
MTWLVHMRSETGKTCATAALSSSSREQQRLRAWWKPLVATALATRPAAIAELVRL